MTCHHAAFRRWSRVSGHPMRAILCKAYAHARLGVREHGHVVLSVHMQELLKKARAAQLQGRCRLRGYREAAYWRIVRADVRQDENASRRPMNPMAISNAATVAYADGIIVALFGRDVCARFPDWPGTIGFSCMTVQTVALRGPPAIGKPV